MNKLFDIYSRGIDIGIKGGFDEEIWMKNAHVDEMINANRA